MARARLTAADARQGGGAARRGVAWSGRAVVDDRQVVHYSHQDLERPLPKPAICTTAAGAPKGNAEARLTVLPPQRTCLAPPAVAESGGGDEEQRLPRYDTADGGPARPSAARANRFLACAAGGGVASQASSCELLHRLYSDPRIGSPCFCTTMIHEASVGVGSGGLSTVGFARYGGRWVGFIRDCAARVLIVLQRWFSGIITACHAVDPGSIPERSPQYEGRISEFPGRCIFFSPLPPGDKGSILGCAPVHVLAFLFGDALALQARALAGPSARCLRAVLGARPTGALCPLCALCCPRLDSSLLHCH